MPSYFQAIRTGTLEGVDSITELVCHPIDQMIKPIAKFATDFAAIGIPSNSSIRIAAQKKMSERFNSVTNIFKAEEPEQARIAAKVATEVFLSTIGFRSGARVARFFAPLFSPPAVTKNIRLITANGVSGTLIYSQRVIGKTCYVYVDRVQATGWSTRYGSIIGQQTRTSGLIHQTLSILKQQATEQGTNTLHIEAKIENSKLIRLAQKRYGRNFSMDKHGIASIKIPLR